MNISRLVPVAVVLSLSVVVGCQREEVKAEPAAPTETPAAVNAQAGSAPAVHVTSGNAQVVVAQQAEQAKPKLVEVKAPAPVGNMPVRLRAEDGREIRSQGNTVVMKAEDGRKITTTAGGEMVLEDPSRPGAKIVVPVPH